MKKSVLRKNILIGSAIFCLFQIPLISASCKNQQKENNHQKDDSSQNQNDNSENQNNNNFSPTPDSSHNNDSQNNHQPTPDDQNHKDPQDNNNSQPTPNEPEENNQDNKPQPDNEEQKNVIEHFNNVAPSLNHGYVIEYDQSNNFYQSLDGLSGEALRNNLFLLQKANRNSTPKYSDLWKTYEDAFVDKFYENDGTVLDFYTEIPNGKDKYNFSFNDRHQGEKVKNEGEKFNREHIIPQSWFGKKNPMRNDAHHVWPSDVIVNAIHGNLPYGTTKNGKIVSSNGSKFGTSVEDGENVFEVINEFKGDIARVYFYFVLTYQDKNLNQGKHANRVFEKINDKYTIKSNFLNTYLEWAKKDDISQFDLDRNNGIYKHQKNRNPFIDYPELIAVYFENDNNFVFKNKGIASKIIKKAN